MLFNMYEDSNGCMDSHCRLALALRSAINNAKGVGV